LELTSSGDSQSCETTAEGECTFETSEFGSGKVRVSAPDFAEAMKSVQWRGSEGSVVEVRLAPATFSQEIAVSAQRVITSEDTLSVTPGSVSVIDQATLTQARVFTVDEALRKVPGVYTRSEEGFGLRPNIGIRGLDPTRSTKVLILEDGMPITYAPYGDNASYYHPPVERFDSIEVVKGSGQIAYGPMTVGGVLNYVTPVPSDRPSGFVTITGGNRDYLNAHLRYGGTFKNTGLLFDGMRKQGEAARDNTRTGIDDYNFKVFRPLTGSQTLTLKANYYGEDSNLTYSGLREDEYRANPRGNPFLNDFVDFKRVGLALTHAWILSPNFALRTNAYGQVFDRAWWRQSSNSGQRPNRLGDAGCTGMQDLYTTCGNEGRVRYYEMWGFEPRARWNGKALGVTHELDFGFRAHYERQFRRQYNGTTPTARTGVTVEDNLRNTDAYSGFVQNRIVLGRLSVTPGLRIENVRYARVNQLLGVRGRTDLVQWIPGIGVAFAPKQGITVFAGVHRGFAPPRAEDVINNTTGGTVDLDPELSWSYEAGVRARAWSHLSFEATFFRMDFENQVVRASVAGGVGTQLTNGGQTLHQGGEFSARWEKRNLFNSRHGIQLRSSYTWIPLARYEGVRFSNIGGFATTLITGNRIPYAPRYLLTNNLIYTHASGVNLLIEGVHTGRQFGDDLNTINPTPDGQRGVIPGNTFFNTTLNVPVEQWRSTFFVTTKNLLDRTLIVDRARGILPGAPRLVQFGLRFNF
jgi:Fe(3+) dicitrate transport protein